MVEEILETLIPQKNEIVLDCTAGDGGHSVAMLVAAKNIRLIALDADPKAVLKVRARLSPFGDRAEVVESNFSDVSKVLVKLKVSTIDKALFDLGWNAGQLVSGRGFSFMYDEPLSMSYGKKPASGFTAQEIVNTWDEATLADVLFGYGEERYARRIAKAIVEKRSLQSITTTFELVDIIRSSVPAVYRKGRIHCATRTFQALRIAVNDELGVAERGLRSVWEHLSCGGRIAVITFHSIEDRVVKKQFTTYVKEGGKLIVKKPLVPSKEEVSGNPRARSAKLRVIEKLCTV